MSGRAVGVFSLEMSTASLVDRILSLNAGIAPRKLRDPRLMNVSDRQTLAEAEDRLADFPLVVDDTPGLTLAALRGRARLMQRRHGIELIVVDYLQLVVGPGDSTRDRVGAVARGLKNLAKELDVAVLACSQLSRPPKGTVQPPTMLDLKESGEIEAAADTILLLHRPWLLTRNLDDRSRESLIVGKQRHGPVGSIPITFDETRIAIVPRAREAAYG